MKKSTDNTKPNVMLVDDNEIFLKLFKKYFEDKDYNVFPFTSGNLALEEFNNNPDFFDLIILDVIMPEINGFEVCREIRKTKDQKILPVIMVTSKSEPKEILKGFEAGANDYVSKPFDKEELLVRSKTLVELRSKVIENEMLNNELMKINKLLKSDITNLIDPAKEIINISENIGDGVEINEFAKDISIKVKNILDKLEKISE